MNTPIIASSAWASKALVVTVIFGMFPFLVTSFAHRGIRPEVTINWYYVGVFLGTILYSALRVPIVPVALKDFIVDYRAILVMVLIGLSFGVVSNSLYGQAVQEAPNPGLALAMINASVAVAYLAAPVMHAISSTTFPKASISWTGSTGVILVIVGMILVARSR